MLAYYRLSTKGGHDTEITRAIDNRPMSSRSQALFRSSTEVKHVLRQHDFNQHSRRSFTHFFPDLGWSWKILLARLAGIALWWERRSQYRELLELDDHLLSDIGVSRTPAEEAHRSQWYLMAWRNSI